MQRLGAILLSLTYLVSTTGVTIAKHYCGGELESVSLTGVGHCCCEDGVDVQGITCCGDEVVQLKVDTQHVAAKVAVAQQAVAVPIVTPIMVNQAALITLPALFDERRPPPLNAPIYFPAIRC
jgi:hypothetical protein